MYLKELSRRIQQLVGQSQVALSTKRSDQYTCDYVDSGKLAGLRASVLSFITMVYGKEHSHYSEFNQLLMAHMYTQNWIKSQSLRGLI